MKMKDRLKGALKDPVRVFGIAMIIFVIICYNVLILHNGYRFLNADDSSELVLARILASEHGILSKNWLYSSELRVFNTNLVFAPMFMLFSSWSTVRAVGGSILLLLYVVSYILIPYAWKYDPKFFYATAFILVMPFANPWYFFGLKMYYIPHVFISFVSFALLGCIYHSADMRRTALPGAFLIVFAFVAGLGGARSLEYTFAPLLLTALMSAISEKKSRRALLFTVAAAASAAAGYLINDRVLSGIYSFHSYANVSFIRLTFEKLEWALDCVLASFGYVIGEYFISFGGICNTLAFLMTVLFFASFFMLYKKRGELGDAGKYMYYFATVTFALNTFLMVTGQNDEYADRFIAIGMVPSIMLIDLVIKTYFDDEKKRRIAGIVVISFFLLVGAKGYVDLLHVAGNGERLGYIGFLEDAGYDHGYATFWNANITTEMSDGKINMTSLDPNAEKPVIFRWLTDKRLIDEDQGKAFLLLTSDEKGMYEGSEPVYSDEYFSVYDIDKSEIDPGEQD